MNDMVPLSCVAAFAAGAVLQWAIGGLLNRPRGDVLGKLIQQANLRELTKMRRRIIAEEMRRVQQDEDLTTWSP